MVKSFESLFSTVEDFSMPFSPKSADFNEDDILDDKTYVSGFILDMFKPRESTGGDGEQQDHHQEGSDASNLKYYAAW